MKCPTCGERRFDADDEYSIEECERCQEAAMMKKCNHLSGDVSLLSWRRGFREGQRELRCARCHARIAIKYDGEYVPWGPSNDSPEEVQDEMWLADGLAHIHCGCFVTVTGRRIEIEPLTCEEACDAYVGGWNEVDRACGVVN